MFGTNNPNSSIDDIFPNEVIQTFFSHLSLQQLLGVMRVNPLWRFLGRGLLNSFLKKEYPFLDVEKLNDSECLVLIEKQQAIYAELAKENGLMPEDLCRERLEAFYADKDKADFTPEQKAFLTTLAIASGMEGENEDKGEAFKLMAQIGNKPMLEAWHNDESISAEHKRWALKWAAENGHLSCVQYFIENVGVISSEDQSAALRWAAMNGYLPCVKSLIEKKVGAELSSKDKGAVLGLAAMNGRLSCVQSLIENAGREISSEDKGAALGLAVINDRKEVRAYLKDYLEGGISFNVNPAPALIFTEKNASSKKRKREEDNENEKPENNKENENNAKWPYCSVM